DAPYPGGYVDVVHQGIRLRYLRLSERAVFFLVDACPECGEAVMGDIRVTDLASLGKAMRDFTPSHTHICPNVVAPAPSSPPVPTWQDLLDALNRIGAELARANDRLDWVDERSDVGR